MFPFLVGTIFFQVFLFGSAEGLILPDFSNPRPVTKAELAEFYDVIRAQFREAGIRLYHRGLKFEEVSTQLFLGTTYRFKMRTWPRRCWYIVVFKTLPKPVSKLIVQLPTRTKC
ncbi:hypothetical protein FBUS_03197 [Fasciolopsis buskii]|uniref:Uncharacterized protein n=1 Tax=Fasciolopsis buskii TaxID=27845 RepID=A0A8E0S7F7_9TREM|nr:hypothetical protein FBUS_03197 [Fasciolopsis buski]